MAYCKKRRKNVRAIIRRKNRMMYYFDTGGATEQSHRGREAEEKSNFFLHPHSVTTLQGRGADSTLCRMNSKLVLVKGGGKGALGSAGT